jgi:hypothetical protein
MFFNSIVALMVTNVFGYKFLIDKSTVTSMYGVYAKKLFMNT